MSFPSLLPSAELISFLACLAGWQVNYQKSREVEADEEARGTVFDVLNKKHIMSEQHTNTKHLLNVSSVCHQCLSHAKSS